MQIDLTNIFTQLGVFFFIMAVGYGLKATKKIDGTFDRALSRVVLDVTMPCMILGSVLNASQLPSQMDILMTLGVAVLVYAVLVVLAEIAVRLLFLKKGRRGVYRFMAVFGNVGFIGFPVLAAIFGSQALIYAAVFNIPFNVLVFTLGVFWLMSDGNGEEADESREKHPGFNPKILTTPCVLSCLAIVVLCLLGVHSVPFLGTATSSLGAMTTPAALIIIGSNLANMPVRDLLGSVRLYLISLVRLVAAPLVVWGVFHFFIDNQLLLGVLCVVAAMPVATNGTLLCFQYGGDMKSMSQGTFISTLLSFATIPLLAMFLSAVI